MVNILPERAVLLIAVPVAVFQNVDTNQDGLLQPEEIKLNRERIIAQLSQSIEPLTGNTCFLFGLDLWSEPCPLKSQHPG